MARGLGRALQRAVSREGVDSDLDTEGRSLANSRRRKVFEYLCRRPCARLGDIGRDLKMSLATVRWHVRDLLENNLLQVEGAHLVPTGLIDPEDATLFATLGSTGRAASLAAAFEAPGISFQELADRVHLTRQSVSKVVAELVELGLVSVREDGRYRRVFPTDSVVRKREANVARAKAFGEALLHRLAEERLAPELLRWDEKTLFIRFSAGAQRILLEVPLDPYTTAWDRTA